MEFRRLRKAVVDDPRTRSAIVATRLPLAPLRPLPDFMVIGGQKCGTTALFAMLMEHRQLRSPILKEIRYFDRWPDRPESFYRAYFPARVGRQSWLTGEATPDYLYVPHVAPAVAGMVPDVRVIAVLRDPVARAHSQYQMNISSRREWLSFDDALAAEEERIAGGPGEPRSPEAHRWSHFGYRRRSHYAPQLARWLEWFPRDQLLVLTSDELSTATGDALQKVTDFLEVDPMVTPAASRRNERSYTAMSPAARELLDHEFVGEAAAVSRVIGQEITWGS